MSLPLIFENFGAHAILISWPNEINESIRLDIFNFNQKIHRLIPDYIIETVPAYCSLTIFIKVKVDHHELINKLKKLYHHNDDTTQVPTTIWKIPVCYDLEFGIDLTRLAQIKKCTTQSIVELHSQALYTVDFLGFLPGFPYLSGLNPLLHTPRLTKPRVVVKKGSVAIGGKQTGVYPIESPGGWHIIGRTPISFFNPHDSQPSFINPLDKIRFQPISKTDFDYIKKQQKYKIIKVLQND
ncbi:MAG: 5-oxoprolinase subunit PxpB [Alcanivoracaceae bacterium]|nr:5-oxoprolinase subunit PxpB [Alcanivoracaceae bacterium]